MSKEEKKDALHVAIAGALGGGTGAMFALAFGQFWIFGCILGVLAAGMYYKPKQVFSTTYKMTKEVIDALSLKNDNFLQGLKWNLQSVLGFIKYLGQPFVWFFKNLNHFVFFIGVVGGSLLIGFLLAIKIIGYLQPLIYSSYLDMAFGIVVFPIAIPIMLMCILTAIYDVKSLLGQYSVATFYVNKIAELTDYISSDNDSDTNTQDSEKSKIVSLENVGELLLITLLLSAWPIITSLIGITGAIGIIALAIDLVRGIFTLSVNILLTLAVSGRLTAMQGALAGSVAGYFLGGENIATTTIIGTVVGGGIGCIIYCTRQAVQKYRGTSYKIAW